MDKITINLDNTMPNIKKTLNNNKNANYACDKFSIERILSDESNSDKKKKRGVIELSFYNSISECNINGCFHPLDLVTRGPKLHSEKNSTELQEAQKTADVKITSEYYCKPLEGTMALNVRGDQKEFRNTTGNVNLIEFTTYTPKLQPGEKSTKSHKYDLTNKTQKVINYIQEAQKGAEVKKNSEYHLKPLGGTMALDVRGGQKEFQNTTGNVNLIEFTTYTPKLQSGEKSTELHKYDLTNTTQNVINYIQEAQKGAEVKKNSEYHLKPLGGTMALDVRGGQKEFQNTTGNVNLIEFTTYTPKLQSEEKSTELHKYDLTNTTQNVINYIQEAQQVVEVNNSEYCCKPLEVTMPLDVRGDQKEFRNTTGNADLIEGAEVNNSEYCCKPLELTLALEIRNTTRNANTIELPTQQQPKEDSTDLLLTYIEEAEKIFADSHVKFNYNHSKQFYENMLLDLCDDQKVCQNITESVNIVESGSLVPKSSEQISSKTEMKKHGNKKAYKDSGVSGDSKKCYETKKKSRAKKARKTLAGDSGVDGDSENSVTDNVDGFFYPLHNMLSSGKLNSLPQYTSSLVNHTGDKIVMKFWRKKTSTDVEITCSENAENAKNGTDNP